MISRINLKFKLPVVYIILGGYFFLFGYNLIHYHKYDFNFKTTCYFDENNNDKATNKHVTYPGFQCPVHNTYSSIHSTLLSSQDFSLLFTTEPKPLKFYSLKFYFNNQFFPSNFLRAPPFLIS